MSRTPTEQVRAYLARHGAILPDAELIARIADELRMTTTEVKACLEELRHACCDHRCTGSHDHSKVAVGISRPRVKRVVVPQHPPMLPSELYGNDWQVIDTTEVGRTLALLAAERRADGRNVSYEDVGTLIGITVEQARRAFPGNTLRRLIAYAEEELGAPAAAPRVDAVHEESLVMSGLLRHSFVPVAAHPPTIWRILQGNARTVAREALGTAPVGRPDVVLGWLAQLGFVRNCRPSTPSKSSGHHQATCRATHVRMTVITPAMLAELGVTDGGTQ